jgi:CheY-like chemotaxis protein
MARVLLADDDPTMLELLTTLMELEGNEVTCVTQPQAVIPAIERDRPQILLLDYHLAGGDAQDTLIALKARQDLRNVAVLVISGMDREAQCLRDGAHGFLLKPFRPAELIERMNALLMASA